MIPQMKKLLNNQEDYTRNYRQYIDTTNIKLYDEDVYFCFESFNLLKAGIHCFFDQNNLYENGQYSYTSSMVTVKLNEVKYNFLTEEELVKFNRKDLNIIEVKDAFSVFLEKGEFVYESDSDRGKRTFESVLWDNYHKKEVKNKMSEYDEKGYFFYTVLDCENDLVLVPGYRFVNRMGYIISKEKVDLPLLDEKDKRSGEIMI